MAVLQQDEVTPSLIGVGARKLASVRASKRASSDRPGWLRSTSRVLGDILGTLVALVFFVVAAFLVSTIVGWAVAGVAVLLLDFKREASSHKARATNERR